MEYTFEDILTNNFLSEECQVIYIFVLQIVTTKLRDQHLLWFISTCKDVLCHNLSHERSILTYYLVMYHISLSVIGIEVASCKRPCHIVCFQ